MLEQLGFGFRGRHQSKPVRLWSFGEARIILNEQRRDPEPRLSPIGLQVDDAEAAATRAVALGAPPVFRRTYAGEQELRAVGAPDGTEVYWNDRLNAKSCVGELPCTTDRSAAGSARRGPLRRRLRGRETG